MLIHICEQSIYSVLVKPSLVISSTTTNRVKLKKKITSKCIKNETTIYERNIIKERMKKRYKKKT